MRLKANSKYAGVITGEQIRRARELLGLNRAQLSQRARTMTTNAIRKAEDGHETALSREQIADARRVLEKAGVQFTNSQEPGVKLKANGKRPK